MAKNKCVVCKAQNLAIDFDKHPSAATALMFKQAIDRIERVIENKHTTLPACDRHMAIAVFQEDLRNAVRLMNLRREQIIATGRVR